jgi:hypothetical protein
VSRRQIVEAEGRSESNRNIVEFQKISNHAQEWPGPLNVRGNNRGFGKKGQESNTLLSFVKLAILADPSFGENPDASVPAKLTKCSSDTRGVVSSAVYRYCARQTIEGLQKYPVVVLTSFHESNQAVFARDLKTHRVICRGVIGDDDHRACFRNMLGIDDPNVFEQRQITMCDAAKDLNRQGQAGRAGRCGNH